MSKHGTTKQYAKQHFVAQCYTKPWHDPDSVGTKMTPYVWVFDKDGSVAKRRAPINLFTETDIYTFLAPDGSRDLWLEHGLQELEDKFTRIRNKTFFRDVWPDAEQTAWLLSFVSTAHLRTRSFRNFHADQWRGIRQRMEEMAEDMRQATPEQRRAAAISSAIGRSDRGASLSVEDVRRLEENPLQHLLPSFMRTELPIMARMSMAVLRTNDPLGFVTSDTPAVYFDPTAYKRQPIYRSPGLACIDIEVTLPLSPQLCLILTHRPDFHGYIDISSEALNELNRLRIAHCDQNFVACRNEIRAGWFEHRPMPEDSWENVRERKIASGEWPSSNYKTNEEDLK
ncbi:DUF4238 domain-containing protein [Noviherbaspirillum malthae]|uniref:DUF4238 domain-containing protein n=1 Tax=Noviherbaspirillum malthae TaxID=1260987 RepID=UPI00188F69AF|nr:DUF4238 domain-containing protein [Noviherbaspirillum malthae]